MDDERNWEEESRSTPLPELTPELEKAIATVLPFKDALDSPTFNPIDYINRLFPDGEFWRTRSGLPLPGRTTQVLVCGCGHHGHQTGVVHRGSRQLHARASVQAELRGGQDGS
jgi:hypothetical protein